MIRLTCADAVARLEQLDDAPAAARAVLDAHLVDLCGVPGAGRRPRRRCALPPPAWRTGRCPTRCGPGCGRMSPAPARARRPAWSAPWLAAAAALLLAVGAALGTLFSTALGSRGSGDAAVAQVAADLEAAEAHYLRAIAGLERIARMDDPALDPAVARVLRANLQEIDGAIRDTRAALAARPDDDVARRGLFEALGGKVALLEQAVSIIDAERRSTSRRRPATPQLTSCLRSSDLRTRHVARRRGRAGGPGGRPPGRRDPPAAAVDARRAPPPPRSAASSPCTAGSTLDLSNISGEVRITAGPRRGDRRPGGATRHRSVGRRAAARDDAGGQPRRGPRPRLAFGPDPRFDRPDGDCAGRRGRGRPLGFRRRGPDRGHRRCAARERERQHRAGQGRQRGPGQVGVGRRHRRAIRPAPAR